MMPNSGIEVTEHHAEHKQCPHCGQFNRAKFPSDVQYPVQYGRNLKALMVYLCIYQLLPYERVSEMFSDVFGHSISTGTLVKAVQDCYQTLAGVEERIQELLAEAQVLHVDETGMRVTGASGNGSMSRVPSCSPCIVITGNVAPRQRMTCRSCRGSEVPWSMISGRPISGIRAAMLSATPTSSAN